MAGMIWENQQFSNVGNLGDIHKHASLTTILMRLGRKAPQAEGGLYFESHAFLPRCPIRAEQAEAWRLFSSSLPATPEAERYRELEEEAVGQGEYLCSTGLAAELVGGLGNGRVGAVLCDRDEPCREALGRCFPGAWIGSAAADLGAGLDARLPGLGGKAGAEAETRPVCPVIQDGGSGAGIAEPAWVVGMIDPFAWGDEEAVVLREVVVRLGMLAERGAAAAVLCFGYGLEGGDWPAIRSRDMDFRGFSCTRLQARGLDDKVYGLGLYADRRAFRAVKTGLAELGWVF